VQADEHACGAGVVEVDVAQQQVAEVRERETTLLEPALERRNAAGRAAVVERETVLGL
jgi:hypothetical protein